MKYLKEYIYFIKENNLSFKLAGFKHGEEKININKAYHTTPVSNLDEILKNGLLPNQPKEEEPNAIFLTLDLLGVIKLARQLKLSKNSKDDFVILEVDCKGIDIYKDPFSVSESGVYTKEKIPPNKIKVKSIIDYDVVRSQKNFKKFMDWWFWDISDKPYFVKNFGLKKYTINI